MRSAILRTVATGVLPITTLFALHLLLRGHDAPGGGFVAGLVTCAGIVLQALAFGMRRTRRRLDALLRPAMAAGLAVAIFAGAISLARGTPWLTHWHGPIRAFGVELAPFSTALVFDVGVYLVVVGATSTLLGVFAEGRS